MNSEWRKFNAPGFDQSVIDFNRRLGEKATKNAYRKKCNNALHVRRLLRRFPDMDLNILKERYPDIDVENMKANLAEYEINERVYTFNRSFYENQEEEMKQPV